MTKKIFSSRFVFICKYSRLTPISMRVYNWLLVANLGIIGIATGIQWLSISKVFSIGTQPQPLFYVNICNKGTFLTEEQRIVCRQYYSMMGSVAEGASMAVRECQKQFTGERWNCSIPRKRRSKRSVFGRGLTPGTRESAFVYAISSAAVAYSVTKDCSRGLINDCGCDKSWPRNSKISSGFEWGGCSDNIAWGKEMARKFIDVQEQPRPYPRRRKRRRKFRKRMRNEITINLNNNMIGRESVANSMRHQCKCHGVSSSCDVITCWRSLPDFSVVGKTLKQGYNNAVQVHVVRKHSRPILRPKKKQPQTYREIGLVYLRKSPNSCATFGRQCDPYVDPTSTKSCYNICCGRGYTTIRRNTTMQCECKFKWCCTVKCSTCNVTITEHICK